MAKRRTPGRTSGAEVRFVGQASSLLDASTNSSPQVSAGSFRESWAPEIQEAGQENGNHPQLRDWVAQLMSRNDRRKNPRFRQPAEVRIQQLSPAPVLHEGVVLAEVQNFSRSGICMTSPVPLVTSSVVQCQIGVPDLRFAIPTLMQVLWVEQTGASEYLAGLRYLI